MTKDGLEASWGGAVAFREPPDAEAALEQDLGALGAEAASLQVSHRTTTEIDSELMTTTTTTTNTDSSKFSII